MKDFIANQALQDQILSVKYMEISVQLADFVLKDHNLHQHVPMENIIHFRELSHPRIALLVLQVRIV